MSLLQRACITLGRVGLVAALPACVFGQSSNSTNYYAPQASEYNVVGNLPGDQANPFLSLNPSGGFLVWQDNITDGSGLGISAVRLTNNFSPAFGTSLPGFRVNEQGTNDQENPQVALLPNGGAAFVWQGGSLSFQHIYARFLSPANTWLTGDIQVNTAVNYQINPAIAALTNGNVVVTWGSYGQDSSDNLQGIYAQILSSTGKKVGGEFLVNQFTPYNQRTPAIAAFKNGGFIVTWVSEKQRSSLLVGAGGAASPGHDSVDIYARIFSSDGSPAGNEFLVNSDANVCANPSVATSTDGSFAIAWSQKDSVTIEHSWDVWARQFNNTGTGGTALIINTQLYGDQYAPKISSSGVDYFVVWTSLGQDGSREGVFGQVLNHDGSHAGAEQRINTSVLNQQMFPAVASDGAGRFVVVWSGFVGGVDSLDLFAQRYASTLQALQPPGAPFVTALDSSSLSVTWPPLSGFDVNYYELYVDGSATPVIVTNNLWSSLYSYSPGSTHSFKLAYVLADGRQSPASTSASGTTWGQDANGDGLPDDWEALYYGANKSNWPKLGGFTELAPGVTLHDVFMWGGNPTDPTTWLKQWITQTPQGLFLNWNTVAGGVYQVQTSSDLNTWTPLGSPRFEAGTTDSLYLGLTNRAYYQIVRNRY